MGNLHGRIPTQALDQEVTDKVEKRRRVATWIDGNTAAYEDETFDSADDQTVLSVEVDLGRRAHSGYFVNDGPGDIQLEMSYNGTDYGGLHELRGGDQLDLDGLNISKVRLTYVDPSAYRCLIG